MTLRASIPQALVVTLLLFADPGQARAARACFHYAPVDGRGTMSLKSDGHADPSGFRMALFGVPPPAHCTPPRPTHFLTFRHLCTGRTVTVPVALPLFTPRIEYRTGRVVYNYGSYTVEVHFMPDGTVDVVYNSGLLRAQ